MSTAYFIRPGFLTDASIMADIYNQGIEDRTATFETEPKSPKDLEHWFKRRLPVLCAENNHNVVGFGAIFPYRERPCYSGVGEFSFYVARHERGNGLGHKILLALIEECTRRHYWKLLSRVFPENKASLKVCERCGFQVVGLYRRHGKLDGVWRDTVIVERLLGEAAVGLE